MNISSRASIVLFALAGIAAVAGAQASQSRSGETVSGGTIVGDTSIFAPLTQLPAPNEYRLASGAPGPRYWQNRADYDLHASLDTAAQLLRGELTMRYTNNSPTALSHIWMQVEQNAFTDSSLNASIYSQDSRFGARGFDGGDRIDRFEQVVATAGKGKARRVPLRTRVWDTMLYVDLAEPLQPGKTATFNVAWHFRIPEHGADRMGRDGSLYELAQWYPRVAVYDDVRGWNTDPYVGQGEFYLEYGDFDYAVTVPAGYIVAGTGTLMNPRDVLTRTEIARLALAARSDSTIQIASAAELNSGAARPRTTGTLTWKFRARNVRDVAWAGAPDYIWDASSWKGITANSYYRSSAESTWKDGADMARSSIMEYSQRWYQYPWPQISVVEGPISGMEYPMLAMEAKGDDKYDLYNVITHEIGHDWFPMLVGSNERIHFWQDEGTNTFINTFSEAQRYPERGDQMQRAAEERSLIENTQVHDVDVPVDIPADRIDPDKLGFTEYVKVSVGLQLLRQEILGPEAFDEALRTYIERWAYKHPTPADFYRTMEDVSGHRLDWFWREWFLEDAHFDQTIDTVATRVRGDTTDVAVAYGNLDRGVLPIRARFVFSDGTTRDYDYPAEVWGMAGSVYVRRYEFPGKSLARIELDPDRRLVDDDRSNNSWTAAPVVHSTAP
ncbi:MAG TPA: M1 family metallopeptidase [Gemmatimonadaceae bacterium]